MKDGAPQALRSGTDNQVRRLRKLSNTEQNQAIAASKAGMDPKTARKYLAVNRLPSEMMRERHWRTRPDPFQEVGELVRQQIEEIRGLEAKTLFEWLQREYPDRYSDGQIRTLQRRIKRWRSTEGPAEEVYFSQQHTPGRLCASDFTHMRELGMTIGGQTLDHLVYHLVLTYSNWEPARSAIPRVWKAERRLAKRRLGVGGDARRASHRQPGERGEQYEQTGGIQPPLRRAHEVCWAVQRTSA